MANKSYDESLASIDERIAQLRARRRDEVARHERKERSARACACMALGEAVLTWFGDWHALSPARFSALLGHIGPQRAALAVAGQVPSTEDALRSYRALRRKIAEAEASEAPEPGEGAQDEHEEHRA